MTSFADKVGRKVRVPLEKPKASGSGSRVSGTRSSNPDKANRKVRLAFQESKRVSDVYRANQSEKNGIKRVNTRSSQSDSVSFVDVNEKLSKRNTRGRVVLKTKKEDGAVFSGNSTQRRKRIYADSGMTEGRARGSNNRMSSFRSGEDVVTPYFDEGKKVQRGKNVQFKDSYRDMVSTGGRKSKRNGMDEIENADKHNFRENGFRDGASETSYKRKAPLRNRNGMDKIENGDRHNFREHGFRDGASETSYKRKAPLRNRNGMDKIENTDRHNFREHGFRDGASETSYKRKAPFRKRNGMDKLENADKHNFREHDFRDGASETSYKRKARLPTGEDVAMQYLDEGKKVQRGKNAQYNDSNRHMLSTDARKSNENGWGKMENADKLNIHENGLRDGASRTSYKWKTQIPTGEDMNQRQQTVGSVEKLRKKKDQGKKIMATDSDLVEKPTRKKKRVFRLDPHDISNKRLVDDTANNGHGQETIKSKLNAGVEKSKNAQFRAIMPSASILSFVEDNLLGRRRDIDFRRAGYNPELSYPLDNIPFSDASERERIEVPVFRNKLEFFAAAKTSLSFPSPDLPEIAFAGRSNVGKSSLLNALTRQWGVVRTSDKPGLTRTINFFKLGPKLCLVDLPGYGFAYAKEEVKESWEELVKEYVSTRIGLKRVCLLVDAKWGMKPRDHELIDLMERSETKYQIVLTKTDPVFPIDVARRAMEIEESLKANKSAVQPLMMVSSKTGAGIRSLRTVLSKIARLVKR